MSQEIIVVDSDSDSDCAVTNKETSHSLSISNKSSDISASSDSFESKSNSSASEKKEEVSDQFLCSDCGKYIPIQIREIHSGRCGRYKPKANIKKYGSSVQTFESSSFSENENSNEELPSIVQSLSLLLPSWSSEHLIALLKSHEDDVAVAYEAVCRLSNSDDPDGLPLTFREAILHQHQQTASEKSKQTEESRAASDSKRQKTQESSPSFPSSSSSKLSSSVQLKSPHPCFNSHAFRLLTSIGASVEANQTSTTLNDLIINNGRLQSAVVFSMMIDWDVLREDAPTLQTLAGNQLTIIHGKDMLHGMLPDGVKLHCPALPNYGSHHSKGFLLFYKGIERTNTGGTGGQSCSGKREPSSSEMCLECGHVAPKCCRPKGPHFQLIITTANLIQTDLKFKSNGVWSACFPLKESTASASSSSSSSSCEFEDDLVRYFDHYNQSAKQSVVDISMLRSYDYNHLRGVKLLACAPGPSYGGIHSGENKWHWGQLALRRAIAKLPSKLRASHQPSTTHALCQFTSLGSIHEKWLWSFLDSMNGVGNNDESLKAYLNSKTKPKRGWLSNAPPCELALVVPTVEQMRLSMEGYASGGSIPLSYKNMIRDHLTPHFRTYGKTNDGRERNMPHIKTFCVYDVSSSSSVVSSSSDPRVKSICPVSMKWCLLTSANLSVAAWGQLQTDNSGQGDVSLKIMSYELGVMFFDTEDSNITPQASHHDRQQDGGGGGTSSMILPLPYDLPPRHLSANQPPWISDRPYITPDCLGNTWPPY